jgi:CheY-like chemotaxis protein
MTRSAALRSQGGAKPPSASPPPEARPPCASPPSLAASPGYKTSPSAPPSAPRAAAAPAAPSVEAGPDEAVTLESLLLELRAIRETQDAILEALRGPLRPPATADPSSPAPEPSDDDGPSLSPIRDRRRKTVVLVDDDPQTRDAAVAELRHAEVPVRAFGEGNPALSAIAEEKPDVIALEVGMQGDMGGKDLVNFIKATMEWVDIPIVLWTREEVASQREARQIHGADEVVPKSGGAAALAARVIQLFRRS